MVAKSLTGPSTPEASAASLPPRLLQLLPAGAKVAGRDSHPLENSAFARRTQQPGYLSTQLHQGIAGSTVFMNYALWESVAHFRAAFTHPDFQQALGNYPSSAVASPHLFTRLSVPNLCVGP
ncbi:MAG: antibiotic biosynthesis monooxygenase [Candidatus Accumulibacter sp.]|uniref:Antibiotic biosynthesis monooxygenase n=1 Tax=Candidatus Accumulibacter affinis TaxID=2954384 RepID=A0A935TIL3_9PROT|nr:antibiotic biosynthesis monooxygenase [Candidatus Accumulibacter affinis]